MSAGPQLFNRHVKAAIAAHQRGGVPWESQPLVARGGWCQIARMHVLVRVYFVCDSTPIVCRPPCAPPSVGAHHSSAELPHPVAPPPQLSPPLFPSVTSPEGATSSIAVAGFRPSASAVDLRTIPNTGSAVDPETAPMPHATRPLGGRCNDGDEAVRCRAVAPLTLRRADHSVQVVFWRQ